MSAASGFARSVCRPSNKAPKTSWPHPQHRIYPYLLRHLVIERPDQVWCADVTRIPMRRGFLCLFAILDCFSRKVLGWQLLNTMDADYCGAALEEAIGRQGRPAAHGLCSRGGYQLALACRVRGFLLMPSAATNDVWYEIGRNQRNANRLEPDKLPIGRELLKNINLLGVAGEPGFEPGLTESESVGLPLTYSPTRRACVPGEQTLGRLLPAARH